MVGIRGRPQGFHGDTSDSSRRLTGRWRPSGLAACATWTSSTIRCVRRRRPA